MKKKTNLPICLSDKSIITQMEKFKVFNEENSLKIDGRHVGNFSIEMIDKNTYSIDNGKHKCIINLVKHSVIEFRKECLRNGFFVFYGTQKDLNIILFSLFKTHSK